jgi:hypothetical protein
MKAIQALENASTYAGLILTNSEDNGIVTHSLRFPSDWPIHYLRGRLFGYMLECGRSTRFVIVTPNDHKKVSRDRFIAHLSIEKQSADTFGQDA